MSKALTELELRRLDDEVHQLEYKLLAAIRNGTQTEEQCQNYRTMYVKRCITFAADRKRREHEQNTRCNP
jgi:hypothetical protein